MKTITALFKNNNILGIIIFFVFIILAVFLISETRNSFKENYFIGKNPDLTRSITISGEGKVIAVPDITIANLGYTAEQATVAEAQKENAEKINELLDQVKKLGIEEKDITTTSYAVYPRYDYLDGRQTLRGYTVNQNMRIKIRNNEHVSKVLALIGSLGLNQVEGIQFEVDDEEVYRQEARVKALANAQKKAEELADVMGVRLGKVVSFTESTQDAFSSQPIFLEGRAETFGVGGAAPEIEAGSREVIIIATVTFELE